MINYKFLCNNSNYINPLFNGLKFEYRKFYPKLDICHLLLRKREEVDYMFQIFLIYDLSIKEIKLSSFTLGNYNYKIPLNRKQ